MAETKELKARLVQKHDTEANWAQAVNFIPKQGEIIIYDIDSSHSAPRLKIGNGVSIVTDLPFMPEANTTYTLTKDANDNIILTSSDGSTQTIQDSNTEYDPATETTFGTVKIGFLASGKSYPVELNEDGQMYVNVPWTDTTTTDTNTTYTLTKNGSLITLTGSDGTTTSVVDDDTDTNTTYTLATQANDGLLSATDKVKIDNIKNSHIDVLTVDPTSPEEGYMWILK